jgi:lipopolysaccharide export system protein LptA
MTMPGSKIVALAVLLAALPATAAFAQQTGRMSGLQIDSDQPIEIESDALEVRDNEGVAIFTGNVQVVQGETVLRAGKMTVHYAGGGEGGPSSESSEIEKLVVENEVYVKSETQTATGDRGTFDMASDTLTLSGDEVVLTEGDNVIVGCKLTVKMSTGVAQLDGCGGGEGEGGRVRMLLQPGSQDR